MTYANIHELVTTCLVTLLSAVVGVIWVKLDKAEQTAQENRISLSYLSKSIEKTMQLTERLTSLEAAFRVEIKNLSVTVKRLEEAMIVLQKTQQTDKENSQQKF